MSSGLIVDSSGNPFRRPKPSPKKRYNLSLEITKAIHTGTFFGLQNHGVTWLVGVLCNGDHARNARAC